MADVEADNAQQSELTDDTTLATALTRPSRFACALIGVAAETIGCFAVFIAKNDVGSGVLLVIGAIFLLMAATGHPIISAKLGDSEIRLATRVKRELQMVLEEAPIEIQPELAEVVLETDLSADDPLKLSASRIREVAAERYEKHVIQALQRIGVVDLSVDVGASGLQFDGIADLHTIRLVIEAKLSQRPVSASQAEMILAKVSSIARRLAPPVGLLLIVSTPPTAAARGVLAEYGLATFVVWNSPADDVDLEQAIRTLGV